MYFPRELYIKIMGKDKRGIDRGKCKIEDRDCDEFVIDSIRNIK